MFGTLWISSDLVALQKFYLLLSAIFLLVLLNGFQWSKILIFFTCSNINAALIKIGITNAFLQKLAFQIWSEWKDITQSTFYQLLASSHLNCKSATVTKSWLKINHFMLGIVTIRGRFFCTFLKKFQTFLTIVMRFTIQFVEMLTSIKIH